MKYNHIVEGKFISRPNRFVAYVDIDGKTEKVHVKNTGRCRELLTENAIVYLEKSENGQRATAYDLIAVRKGERLVNMDSNAPNKAVGEWLLTKALFPSLKTVQAEKTYKNSRFDFYVETEEEKIFLEVKGVTLEKENAAYFPVGTCRKACGGTGGGKKGRLRGIYCFCDTDGGNGLFLSEPGDTAGFCAGTGTGGTGRGGNPCI